MKTWIYWHQSAEQEVAHLNVIWEKAVSLLFHWFTKVWASSMHRGLQEGVYRFLSTQWLSIGESTYKRARFSVPRMQAPAPQGDMFLLATQLSVMWENTSLCCSLEQANPLSWLVAVFYLLSFFLSFLTFSLVVFSWGLELITNMSQQFNFLFVCVLFLSCLAASLPDSNFLQ